MILVTGAGGFIGGHLVKALLGRGEEVKAVDVKQFDGWWQLHHGAHNRTVDLRSEWECKRVVAGCYRVFNLAADMGGVGFITRHHLDPMLSSLVNTHLLLAARSYNVERYLFTSSACVYGQGERTAVRERDAYPAHPELGYGEEKLFGERMCHFFREEGGVDTRVARLHNAYGPRGSWNDGREKAPAAICRKVAHAIRDSSNEIEVWGDGRQERSFMHISDCIEGLQRIMDGPHPEPVNLGTSELVTVNQLVGTVEGIAGVQLDRRYLPDAAVGVRGRNSDNTLIRERYGWEPSTRLEDGLVDTYAWIAEQVGVRDRVAR